MREGKESGTICRFLNLCHRVDGSPFLPQWKKQIVRGVYLTFGGNSWLLEAWSLKCSLDAYSSGKIKLAVEWMDMEYSGEHQAREINFRDNCST